MNRLYVFWVLSIVLLISANAPQAQDQFVPNQAIDLDGRSLYLQDPYLYVAEREGFRIYDVSQGMPQLVGRLRTDAPVTAVGVAGNIALCGLDNRDDPNLLVVDVTDKNNPTVLHNLQTTPETPDELVQYIYTWDNTFFIGMQTEGLLATRLDEENRPVIIDSLPLDDFSNDLVGNGPIAYIANDFDVLTVDFSDPSNMQIIDRQSSLDFNNGLDIDGNRLAVAEGLEGITFYDISDPRQPSKIKSFKFASNELSSIALRQGFAYAGAFLFSSFDVTAPDIPGRLSVVDLEFFDDPRVILRFTPNRETQREMVDVIAHAGYVYALGNAQFLVFRHGPIGVRPTATPTFTPTVPTPTPTNTPTNTPPALATATPVDGQQPTNTPTPSFTPTPPPVPTPTPTNTPTPPPAPTDTPPSTPTSPPESSPTPISDGSLEAALTVDFDGPFFSDEPFSAQLPFTGDFEMGEFTITGIPTDNAFEGATNGQGLIVRVRQSQAVTMLGEVLALQENLPVLLRVNVRSDGPGASIALAALDAGDNSLATNIPGSSAVFAGRYRKMAMLFKAPTGNVLPILQVVATGSEQVTVFFDNFEIIPIPQGTNVPTDLFGSDGTAP